MNIRYVAPRYWPTWSILVLLRLIICLPYAWQLRIGEWLGMAIACFSKRLRHITLLNLKLCFPHLNALERHKLLKANFKSSGIGICEAALAWWGNPKRLKGLLHIHGYHHLESALQHGKGVILLGSHFASLEIIGRLFSLEYPLAVVYREQKNPLLASLNRNYLNQFYQKAIPRENIRGIVKALKNNLPIWYTPDVDAGSKHSLFIPFFNIPTATITATSRLARLSQAMVVPISFYRKENKQGYDLYFHSPWDDFPSQDIRADTVRINQFIEQAILKEPGQYLWQYKRFKTRPPGEARFYSKTH